MIHRSKLVCDVGKRDNSIRHNVVHRGKQVSGAGKKNNIIKSKGASQFVE